MKRILSLVAVISIIVLFWGSAGGVGGEGPAKVPEAIKHKVVKSYGILPLSFEANRGQTDARVKFLSRGRGYTLFLGPTEAVLSLTKREAETKAGEADFAGRPRSYTIRAAVLRMQLVDANPNPKIVGVKEQPGKSHYFIGKDPTKWFTDIPTYARVQYKEIYPGIDLIYYGNQGTLEYDFVVEPGADPKVITLAFEGIDKIQIDAQGDLVMHAAGGDVRWQKPVVYQEVDGVHKPVAGSYVLRGSYQVGFQVAAYDSKKSLIIDPVLSYSTYLGGGGDDIGFGIAVDSAGNAYVTGNTAAVDFPTANPVQGVTGGSLDSFVTKIDTTAAGAASLLYSTYLGGTDFDSGRGIAVDTAGNAYVVGKTSSTDFPTTVGAFQTVYGGGPFDVFVAKLNAAGSMLVYSTFLGGSGPIDESGNDIAVDVSGNAYMVGFTDSTDFPTTPGAFDTDCGTDPVCNNSNDVFVAKLNPDPSITPAEDQLVYSTFLGGSREDSGRGIAVDASGNAYVTGFTTSDEFPATVGAFDTRFGGAVSVQAFVTKLNPDPSITPAADQLIYSTSLGAGGSGRDFGRDIAVEPGCAMDCNAYVMGTTDSTDFPTTAGAFQTVYGGGPFDVFVAKLNPDPTGPTPDPNDLVYSTYLGGSGFENFGGIDTGSLAVDSSGNAYVTCETTSIDFPTANPLQPACSDPVGNCQDAFVTKLNAAGSALVYSTYLGGTRDVNNQTGSARDVGVGIAVDTAGNAYVTGQTEADNFPTTVNAFQQSPPLNSIRNAFVAKISEVQVVEVTIDIKPGSFPNSINLGSNGNVPVAIFSSATFDATTVDPLTVTLADVGVKVRGNGTPQASEQDVNGDGLLDLVVHIDTEGLSLTEGDEEAVLTGQTFSAATIQGSDLVRVVP